MKSADICLGGRYLAKTPDGTIPVTIIQTALWGGWVAREMRTHHNVLIRSAAELQPWKTKREAR